MHPKLLTAVLIGTCLVPLSTSSALARVRDSSTRARPGGLGLADVDGDHISDWVGIETANPNGVQVRLGSNRDFPIARMNGGWLGSLNVPVSAQYTFTGHFASKTRDDVCTVSLFYVGVWDTRIACFEYDTGYQQMFSFGAGSSYLGGSMTPWMPTQLSSGGEYRGYAVGDYDGDGYDEVLTYNRNTGENVQVWRYNLPTGTFVAHPTMDLSYLSISGPVDILAGEFTYADSSGTHRDDVIVYNRFTQQLQMYASLPWGAGPAFLSFYWTVSPVTAAEDFVVANADGDAFDDLISVNRTTGAMHFRGLEVSVRMLPLPVVQGNLPSNSTQPLRLMWASTSAARDQPFAVFADGSVAGYWPVTDGNNQKTYWWFGSYWISYVWSRIAP